MSDADVDLSAFWLFPDWPDDPKEPFWMRPPKTPAPTGYSAVAVMAGPYDWRFGGRIETYKSRHGSKGLADYVAGLERLHAAGKIKRDGSPSWA